MTWLVLISDTVRNPLCSVLQLGHLINNSFATKMSSLLTNNWALTIFATHCLQNEWSHLNVFGSLYGSKQTEQVIIFVSLSSPVAILNSQSHNKFLLLFLEECFTRNALWELGVLKWKRGRKAEIELNAKKRRPKWKTAAFQNITQMMSL